MDERYSWDSEHQCVVWPHEITSPVELHWRDCTTQNRSATRATNAAVSESLTVGEDGEETRA